MSPQVQNRLVEFLGFPRVSGDEPVGGLHAGLGLQFSPREWG